MTGADLPNAFPYFIAIERLVSADIGAPVLEQMKSRLVRWNEALDQAAKP